MIFKPPSSCRLNVPIVGQLNHGECLAACASMVCTYLQIAINYNQLLRVLDIETGVGTPFSKIRNLEKRGISVIYEEYGTIEELYNLLSAGWPTIVSVETSELFHWRKLRSQHVVVVSGMDEQYIYINDPAFPSSILKIPIGDFDLAWLPQDEKYAVLMPS